MGGGVATKRAVMQLPFDVDEQAAGADPEQVRARPSFPELLVHERHPGLRFLGRRDPTGRLEAHGVIGIDLEEAADLIGHDQSDRQGRVDRRLAS